MVFLLSACAPQEPSAAPPAGVTILPVDAPPTVESGTSTEPTLPTTPVAPPFQVCTCDGACRSTSIFVTHTTDDELAACEKRWPPKGSAANAPRDQRVLDCFFPKSGTRLQLCPAIPQQRSDFDAYLRSAIGLPQHCFAAARVRGLGWGPIEVTFRLDGGGYAQDVQVDTSDTRLATCVRDELKPISFATYAGDVTRVRYRLVFDMPR